LTVQVARSSRSARNQSASGEPPANPRASQYEYATRATASWKDPAGVATTAAGATDRTSGSDAGVLEVSTADVRGTRLGLADLRRAGAAAALDTATCFSETRFLVI
jgi:hypothetical protein